MFEPKKISSESVAKALDKAVHYRLLNEPREAESICRDVLLANPMNQLGLVTLLLALTDQFGREFGGCLDETRKLLPQIKDEYQRIYYEGVVTERWGKAQLAQNRPQYVTNDWLRQAMSFYEAAEKIRPAGNDDSILRWNACARMLNNAPTTIDNRGASSAGTLDGFDDEVPLL
jgi:hypothetical protein